MKSMLITELSQSIIIHITGSGALRLTMGIEGRRDMMVDIENVSHISFLCLQSMPANILQKSGTVHRLFASR